MNKTEFKQIPLNRIHVDRNYRKTFKDKSIAELAQSIKENGVIEPIIVRAAGKGYMIVAGERRYRASMKAGLATIPAVVREVEDDDVLKLQIIENVQREGVQFMEEAYALRQLRNDGAYDASEIAKLIGKSEAYVYYMLRLTEMSDDARTIAEKGWISKAVAWHIAKLKDADQQTQAANDLARTQSGKLVTENSAKSYIRDNFQADSEQVMRRERRKRQTDGDDFTTNWKRYLVNFSAEQFERFKAIVLARTETALLCEAVDLVMRRETELKAAQSAAEKQEDIG